MRRACGVAVACWTARRRRSACHAAPLPGPAREPAANDAGIASAATAGLGLLLRHRRDARRSRRSADGHAPRFRVPAPHRGFVSLRGRGGGSDPRPVARRYRWDVSTTPLLVGDDVTDEFGFKTVNRLDGHSIKVGPGRTVARWRLGDVEAVRAWLEQGFAAVAG